MTISSTTRIAGPFIGNGTASVFPFTFKVFSGDDLRVVLLPIATNVETTLVWKTDFSLSLNGNQNTNPGGSITLLAGPLETGFTLTITSDIPNLQPTDLTNQGGFYPEVITDALDRATIQIQQLSDDIGRSIAAPISDASPNMELPVASDRANKVLGFDDNGNVIALTTEQFQALIAAFGGPTTVPQTWSLTGTGGDTYALSPVPLNTVAAIFIVEMGGVIQDPSTYTITTNSIVFDANVAAGIPVSVRNFGVARSLNDSVTTSMLVDDAVTTAKIDALAVTATELASNAVTTAKIADDAVTYAKIQNVSATDRVLGRQTAGAGNVEEITCTAAGRTMIGAADATAQRTALSLGNLAVLNEVSNAQVATTAAIALSKLQTIGASTVLGNAGGTSAAPSALTPAQGRTVLQVPYSVPATVTTNTTVDLATFAVGEERMYGVTGNGTTLTFSSSSATLQASWRGVKTLAPTAEFLGFAFGTTLVLSTNGAITAAGTAAVSASATPAGCIVRRYA